MARHRMRDVVVLLPGITGSVLAAQRSDGSSRDVWNLSGEALWSFLRSRGHELTALELPRHDPFAADGPATEVVATSVIAGFHGLFGVAKVNGYRSLLDAISNRFNVVPGRWGQVEPANFLPFPYDWRLSNRVSAQRLAAGVDRHLAAWKQHTGDPGARVILLAHSMGGLVARYWLEVLEGWRDCRALVTFGTPYRGSLDSLDYLANGYKKPFVDLSSMLLSCPAIYELLPIYRAIKRDNEWCRPSETVLPLRHDRFRDLADSYVRAAAAFHDEIKAKVAEHRNDPDYLRQGYTVAPFVGVHMSTSQSATIAGSDATATLSVSDEMPSWVTDDVAGGDGTVPRASAVPIEMENPFGSTFLGERHGSLQANPGALDDLVERLRQSQAQRLGAIQGSFTPSQNCVDLRVDDLFLAEEPVTFAARLADRDDRTIAGELDATVTPVLPAGASVRFTLSGDDDYRTATIPTLAAGRYKLTVAATGPHAATTLPVTDDFEVAGGT